MNNPAGVAFFYGIPIHLRSKTETQKAPRRSFGARQGSATGQDLLHLPPRSVDVGITTYWLITGNLSPFT